MLEEGFDPGHVVVVLEEDEARREGTGSQKQTTHCLQASLKRVDRRNTLIGVRCDVRQPADEAAAAAGEQQEDNKVDPVAGKALIEKKSQKMQVKQEQAQWDQDTRIHHRSHDDQVGPAGDPGRDLRRRILLEVQVGEEQAGMTRPNGDV